MPGATTNFGLPIALANDLYNHLTIDNAAYQKIDAQMKKNQDAAFSTAAHTKSGNQHVLVRNIKSCPVFYFTATDDYRTGNTITVDGVAMSAKLPTGAGLSEYAWRTNSQVICIVNGANLTVFTSQSASAVAQAVYPVGSVFISVVATNPTTLLGFGTWERIQGRFLFGADGSHAAGTTGGEERVTLSRAQIPSHQHFYNYSGRSTTTGTDAIRLYDAAGLENAYTGSMTDNCGGESHNNMPPYLSVYIWKRTA